MVNNHPENQTAFKKLPLIPGEKRYSDAVTSTAKKNDILIFTDSLPKGIRMYEFNRLSKHGNAKLLCFSGAKSHQLLHYTDVNLDGRKPPDSVIIHIGVNDVMYDNSQSNIENLVRNIKKMTEKCRNAGAKNVFISGLVYTTRVVCLFWRGFMKRCCLTATYIIVYTSTIETFVVSIYIKMVFIY